MNDELYGLIAEHAAEAAAIPDWDEVALILSDPDGKRLENPTPMTFRRLCDQFSAVLDGETHRTEADLILASLATSSIERAQEVRGLLTGDGVDMRRDDVQGLILLLASVNAWPGDLAARLQATGVTFEPLAGRAVTAEECRMAWESKTLRDEFSGALWNAYLSEPAAAGDRVAFVAGLRAMADALES